MRKDDDSSSDAGTGAEEGRGLLLAEDLYLLLHVVAMIRRRRLLGSLVALCEANQVLVLHGTGGYDKEDKSARAYDLTTLKYWVASNTTNFLVVDYERSLRR